MPERPIRIYLFLEPTLMLQRSRAKGLTKSLWCFRINPARHQAAGVAFGSGSKSAGKKGVEMTSLKTISEKLTAWRRYREAVRELSQLSDRELNDIGIR